MKERNEVGVVCGSIILFQVHIYIIYIYIYIYVDIYIDM